MENRVLAVLPALVGESGALRPRIPHEAVRMRIGCLLEPGDRSCQRRPELVDQSQIAGTIGVGAGEHDEQRRGVDTAVVAPEWQLARRGHLALACLMDDLARRCILEGRGLGRLVLREEAQHAPGNAGVEPQRLQCRDDGVAPEGR